MSRGPHSVFISHGWHDRWIAAQMARLIQQAGAEAFVDIFDIKKGDRIEQRILEELPKCDELVALLTPWSVDRNWVWTEMASAWIMRKRFVGVLYGISLREIDQERGGLAFLAPSNMASIDEFGVYLAELAELAELAQRATLTGADR